MQLIDTNQYHLIMSQLGLTYNEAEVYLYLLNHGESGGSLIFNDLKLDKSSFYRAIKGLSLKNLIYTLGEERNRQFGANQVTELEKLLGDQEKKLTQAKKAYAELPQIIEAYVGSRYKQKNIFVIRDSAGYDRYLNMRLDCRSKLIRDISGQATASAFYDNYDEVMADFIAKRIKAGIFLRQLSKRDDVGEKWDKTSKELNKEVRILPSSFEHQAVFAAWDETAVFFSKDRGSLIGVAIEDPLITQLLVSMFDVIWEISTA